MSLKEKLKNLFKKKIITINDRSSVNAIYTASNKDLKKVTDQVNHIQDTLDNLNIPVLPDHSDFATRSQDNTFTASNTFTKAIKCETFPEISKGNYEPTANKQLTPKFYVDKKVNDNIAGLDNKVQMLHNQAIQTSKTYTDAEIAKIPQPDLSGYAKTNETNRFQHPQEIAREVVVYGDHNASAAHITFKNISTNERIGYIGKASLSSKDITLKCETGNLLCDNAVTNPKSIATKEYVDGKSSATLLAGFYTLQPNLEFEKVDIKSGLWAYKIVQGTFGYYKVGTQYASKKFTYQIFIENIVGNDTVIGLFNNTDYEYVDSNGQIRWQMKDNANWFLAATDFKPGSGGRFWKETKIKLIFNVS